MALRTTFCLFRNYTGVNLKSVNGVLPGVLICGDKSRQVFASYSQSKTIKMRLDIFFLHLLEPYMFKVNDNSKEKSIFPSKCENHHFLFELFCPILENRKIQVSYKKCFIHVGGYYTPNQNLAWFALYLKIITIFFFFF